jgi:general secretion pathway protein D
MNGNRKMKWSACCCALVLTSGVANAQGGDPFDALLGGGAAAPAEPAVEAPAAPVAPATDLGFSAPASALPANPQDVTEEQREQESAVLSVQERVRLEADEKLAAKAMQDAKQAMINNQWAIAIGKFDEALTKLKDIPKHRPAIQEARRLKSDAYVEMARTQYDRRREGGDIAQAYEFLLKAAESFEGNERIAPLKANLDLHMKRVEDGRERLPIEKEPKYANAKAEIAKLMLRGRKELDLGDFIQAEKTFEQVLAFDRHNIDALRFLERVAEKRWEANRVERKASVMKQMADGEERWLQPRSVDQSGQQQILSSNTEATTREDSALEKKLSQIMIREIRFQRADISDVIDYLVQASRESDPDGIGVNIIYMDPNQGGGGAAAPAAPAAGSPFDFGAPPAPAPAMGGTSAIPPITLELRNVTLLDALKFVTDLSGLYYRVERNVVLIEREGTGRMITRFYPVDPARWQQVAGALQPRGFGGGTAAGGGDPFGGAAADPFGGGGAAAPAGTPDMKEIFTRFGMRFPADAQIAFEPLISQLVVTLTPDQFPQFEEILAKINVAPRQVEIEARFVEVLQRDLEQLGFEWILNDDAELLVRSGPGPVASRERIQIDRNTSGLTSGLRFFNFDGVSNSTAPVSRGGSSQNFLGDILSARGVLTNPELQLVVQALDQKGNSDLLSAPRVTTINGVNAIIQVVNEIIYPTEFDVTENDIQVQGGGGTADDPSQPVFVPPTVIPGGFETREVGVILNVTPTVNPDNYTINLVMLPEIAELVDWIQYGTQVPVGDQIYTVNMPQPVFASRNITTSMIVWDGHTVVMGGLIREDLVTFKDKVPLLGDIPLIGRLFRSEGRKSEKRNLLIFVTARLVDPAGNSQNAETRNQARPNTGLTSSGGTVTTP